MTLQPEKIGPYDIKHSIGFGGFATVYLAYDPRLKREIALKVMSEHLLEDPIFHERFMREVKTIAGLEHRSIVPIYDSDVHNLKPYLTMRYMRGGTLWDRLKDEGKLPLDEVFQIVNRLAAGLDYAHDQNVVHRDIKPANILLDSEGMPYLSDFGIAWDNSTNPLTKKNALLGSLPYMSPEQLENERISRKTDVYQFGIMIFELLTGRHPFIAENAVAYLYLHTKEPIPSIHSINPELPAACDEIIYKALAKDPDTRYDSLGQMANELFDLVGKQSTLTLKKTIQNLSKTTNSERFPGYEIVRELGRGNIGIVYLVKNSETQNEFALKALPPELLDDPGAIRHLRHQATILPELKHEAVVPIHTYRVGERSGRPYLLMDYMNGGNLDKVLASSQMLSLEKAIEIIERLTSALSQAHELGLIHGDIKPSNILLDAEQNTYLTDFGLSLVLNHVTILTVSETAVGSPAYKAPERWQQNASDPTTDFYQLSIILFQLLTGQHPFNADGYTDYQEQHLNAPVPSVRELNATLPPSIETFFVRSMAKKPEDRYQTAEAFLTAIKGVQKEKQTLEEQKKLAELLKATEAAMEDEDWPQAMASLKIINDIDPDYHDAIGQLDVVQQKIQDEFYEKQRQQSERFQEQIESDQFDYTYKAATSYFKQQKWIKAIDKLNETLKINPAHKPTQQLLEEAKIEQTLVQLYETANEYIRIENWGMAIDALKRIQTISNEYRDADSKLDFVEKENKLAEQYERAKRFYESNPSRLRRARERFEELDNVREAYKDVPIILREINQKIVLDNIFEKANELEKDEQWEEAIAVMEKIVAVDGDFRQAEQKLNILRNLNEQATLYNQGMDAFSKANWEEAIRFFEQSDSYKDAEAKKELAKNNLFLEAHYQEAELAIDNNDWALALEYLEGIQANETEYKDVPELLKKVKREVKPSTLKRREKSGSRLKAQRFLGKNGRFLWAGIGLFALVVLGIVLVPLFNNPTKKLINCLEEDTAVYINYLDSAQNVRRAAENTDLHIGFDDTSMNIEVVSQSCPTIIDSLQFEWEASDGQISYINPSQAYVTYSPDSTAEDVILQIDVIIEKANSYIKPFNFHIITEE